MGEWQINDGGVSDLMRLIPLNVTRVFIAAHSNKLNVSGAVRRLILNLNLRDEQRL